MRKILGLTYLVLLLSAASPAAGLADTPPSPAQAATPAPTELFLKRQEGDLVLAKSSFIGRNIYADDGAVIGDIEDLVLAGPQIEAVVVGVGGFLGVGERKVGIRFGALRFETKDNVTRVVLPGVTKEALALVEPFAFAEPKKNILQKAGEAAKVAARRAGDVAKAGIEKAKEAVQGTGEPDTEAKAEGSLTK